jgi:tRNA threonylcarbamoyladenosine biosynthesis protein TsaE
LKGGECIELVSDIGGGKTTFVRGLARGFGSQDHVASPSFTISRVYKSTKGEIHHFDFYRLDDPGLAGHEVAEALADPVVVVVAEWADRVAGVMPPIRLAISINNTSETKRSIIFTADDSLSYLLEGIC